MKLQLALELPSVEELKKLTLLVPTGRRSTRKAESKHNAFRQGLGKLGLVLPGNTHV